MQAWPIRQGRGRRCRSSRRRQIEKRIVVVRERQVMRDEDLADLYGVETKRLIQQVKRNLKRFPGDFMFQLTRAEAEVLRSQIATSKDGRGGLRTEHPPHAKDA